MSDGYTYRCEDAQKWVKTEVKDTGNSSDVFNGGKIMHCHDGNKWYWNYPNERSYEQYFNVTWTQSYKWNGDRLTVSVDGDHVRAGDTEGYIGMWGFDNTAMKKFVADGLVQSIMIQVNYDDPSGTVTPNVYFAAHDRKTKPNVANFLNIWESFKTQKEFINTADNYYSTWVSIPIANWLDGEIGGIAVWGITNTAANYARFAGKTTANNFNGYNTRLYIKVLK
jgi:hypothetical protein